MVDRKRARELAHSSLATGNVLDWFELLYVEANGDPQVIPWADLRPNLNLVDWLKRWKFGPDLGTALVVGCGLGDDAEYLASAGFGVTAFDISPTAVAWCRQRFPESKVAYEVHDVFRAPPTWQQSFDLVVEAYTLQVLPGGIRCEAMRKIAEWVSPDGVLLVISRGRDSHEPEGEMPWPLTREEFSSIQNAGLVVERFDDFNDDEDPPVRRFRVICRRTHHRQAR